MEQSEDYQKIESTIRPWKENALSYMSVKHPQIFIKGSGLASALAFKFVQTKVILKNCGLVASGITKILKSGTIQQEVLLQTSMSLSKRGVSSTLIRAGKSVTEKMMMQPQIGSQVLQVTSSELLKETVKLTGGAWASSQKVFTNQITSKANWGVAAVSFVVELTYLNWQLRGKKINEDTYKRRRNSSFFSNIASVLGGSIGASIGCLIGNTICLGIGGYYGAIIVGLIGSAASSLATDYYFDP